MKSEVKREVVRVLFHLNGYTKVVVESSEGLGLADGGVVWELATAKIPPHLWKIGSRFIVETAPLSPEEESDVAAIREAQERIKIFELSGAKA